MKTEFQDVKENDIPNEERKLDPKTNEETKEYKHAVSVTKYWGRKKIFEKYDNKYRREGAPSSQKNYAQVINLTPKNALTLLFKRNKI